MMLAERRTDGSKKHRLELVELVETSRRPDGQTERQRGDKLWPMGCDWQRDGQLERQKEGIILETSRDWQRDRQTERERRDISLARFSINSQLAFNLSRNRF